MEAETQETETPVEETAEVQPEVVEDATPKAEPDKEKYSRKVQKSINRYTARASAAEREAQALREENERLKKATEIKAEPNPDNYTDDEQFQRDKTLYTEQQVAKIREEERERIRKQDLEEQQRIQYEQQQDNYVEQKAKTSKDFEDYPRSEALVDNIINMHRAGAIKQAILRAPNATAMVDYLGKHSDDLEKIARLSPIEQGIEMGLIQGKVDAKPLKTKSTAPDPATGVRGSAEVVRPDASLSQYEWNRKKNGF